MTRLLFSPRTRCIKLPQTNYGQVTVNEYFRHFSMLMIYAINMNECRSSHLTSLLQFATYARQPNVLSIPMQISGQFILYTKYLGMASLKARSNTRTMKSLPIRHKDKTRISQSAQTTISVKTSSKAAKQQNSETSNTSSHISFCLEPFSGDNEEWPRYGTCLREREPFITKVNIPSRRIIKQQNKRK